MKTRMPDIKMRRVRHSEQRYKTVGDWQVEDNIQFRGDKDCNGLITVKTSELGNEDYEFLICLHELVEGWLCRKRGITDEAVTRFDKKFEAKRKKGNNDEPGDDPKAPYRKEHFLATNIERIMAAELGVDWKRYEDTLYALP